MFEGKARKRGREGSALKAGGRLRWDRGGGLKGREATETEERGTEETEDKNRGKQRENRRKE